MSTRKINLRTGAQSRLSPRQALTRIILPGLFLWAVLWACNTPSIPMPPPGPDSFSFEQTTAGLVVLHISANDRIPPGATVTVKNLKNGLFVGGPAGFDGSFDSQPFLGDIGDVAQISFVEEATGDGGVTCLVIGNFDGVPVEDPRCGG